MANHKTALPQLTRTKETEVKLTLASLAIAALLCAAWASPGETDIKTCTDHGQSRETCIHSIMP